MTGEEESCQQAEPMLHFKRQYGCHHIDIWYPYTPRDIEIVNKIVNLIFASYPGDVMGMPKVLGKVAGMLAIDLRGHVEGVVHE